MRVKAVPLSSSKMQRVESRPMRSSDIYQRGDEIAFLSLLDDNECMLFADVRHIFFRCLSRRELSNI